MGISTNKGKVALVVDDSIANRNVVVLHLKRFGFQVFAFDDGEDAWKFLCAGTEKVQLIVSDFLMPKMDGLELLANIKQDARLSAIPFLMMSALSDRKLMIDAINQGVAGYLLKPVTAAIVARALQKHVPELLPDAKAAAG